MHFIYSTLLKKGHQKALEWFSTLPYIREFTSRSSKGQLTLNPSAALTVARPRQRNGSASCHLNYMLNVRGIKFVVILKRNELQ